MDFKQRPEPIRLYYPRTLYLLSGLPDRANRWPAALPAPLGSSAFHLQVNGSIPSRPESPHAPLEPYPANHLSAVHTGNRVKYELLQLDLNIWLFGNWCQDFSPGSQVQLLKVIPQVLFFPPQIIITKQRGDVIKIQGILLIKVI